MKKLFRFLVRNADDSVSESLFKQTKSGKFSPFKKPISCADVSRKPKRTDDQYPKQGRVRMFERRGVRKYGETTAGKDDND